jgi:signal transduction histidine kinase
VRTFSDLSIRQKLMTVSVLSSGLALLLACAAFLAYELVTFRQSMVRTLGTQAEMLSYNGTSPLLFNDADAAVNLLGALRADAHILSAGILNAEGQVFALYSQPGRGGAEATLPPGPSGQSFHDGRLVLVRPIVSTGKQIGRLYLESDLGELEERVRRYAAITGLVLLASMAVAIVISAQLHRAISEPILGLVKTAKTVSLEQNYSVRAVARTKDELGLLVTSFNEMLAQIQTRDRALQQARDDLERRVLERTRDLATQAQELARSNAELEQFAYVASHDLQEPLRMVASYTQLLARRYRGRLDADADEFIGFAVDGVVRMQALINDLLTYSRVGTQGKEFAPVDCEAVFDQAMHNLGATIDEKGATVTHGPLPVVLGDATQLVQLFQNLIGNGTKFHGKEPPRVHVSAEKNGRDYRFSFSDNGIGIEPQYRDKIFVIFQRLHNRAQYPGTGIGLAICKKIVERHGGRIWVESRPGEGSNFQFTIPDRRGQPT